MTLGKVIIIPWQYFFQGKLLKLTIEATMVATPTDCNHFLKKFTEHL